MPVGSPRPSRQPEYRNLAISPLLVAAGTTGDRRSARKRLRALAAFQRLAADLEQLFPDLEPVGDAIAANVLGIDERACAWLAAGNAGPLQVTLDGPIPT